MTPLEYYKKTRSRTEEICRYLQNEDFVVQPITEVSPPKWHLGHTTWFFETMILKPNMPTYEEWNPQYNFIFNSYYESMGNRINRNNRGDLSRPTVGEVMAYRQHVDQSMFAFLNGPINTELKAILELGLSHEEQHQELLLADIKYILGTNPLFPSYKSEDKQFNEVLKKENKAILIDEGLYEIGYDGPEFHFDNEEKRHSVFLEAYAIDSQLISNEAYLQFIMTNSYKDFRLWHSDAWQWLQENQINTPLYWHLVKDEWHEYTLDGLKPLILQKPVSHISFYEAAAFAAWAGMRLPTEAEWEVASSKFGWGQLWEWTNSAYLPYPRYQRAKGALGEYNGKFMINQMVLRGASLATPEGHSRASYRNFYHPYMRLPFTGLRLAQNLKK